MATVVTAFDHQELRFVQAVEFQKDATPEQEAAAMARLALVWNDPERYTLEAFHGPSVAKILKTNNIRLKP